MTVLSSLAPANVSEAMIKKAIICVIDRERATCSYSFQYRDKRTSHIYLEEI